MVDRIDPFASYDSAGELPLQWLSGDVFGKKVIHAYRRAYNGDPFSGRWWANLFAGHRIGGNSVGDDLADFMQSAFTRAAASGREGDLFWKRMERISSGKLLGAIGDPDMQKKVAGVIVSELRSYVSPGVFFRFDGFCGVFAVAISDRGYLGAREITSDRQSFCSTETNYGAFDFIL